MSRSINQNASVIIFEPKVDLPSGAQTPDSYDGSARKPAADFVVSRQRDGTIASVYSDLKWDWTPYNPSGRSSPINFGAWCDGEPAAAQRAIIEEMRWLMFILIWLRDGPPLSYATFVSYLPILTRLARFAEGENGKILKVLNDPIGILRFLDEVGDYHALALSSLLSILGTLGEEIVGFPVVWRKTHEIIKKRALDYKARYKQHPPIPSRIYSAMLKGLVRELDDFEEVAERYLALVETCASDPLLGRKQSQQRKIQQRLGNPKLGRALYRPEFPKLLVEYGLLDYFRSKDLGLSVKGAAKGLTRIQLSTKLLIHAYSGMRKREARELPFHCDEEFTSGGRTHYLITGKTTKLNNGRIKRTRWVTSREGVRAARTAQRMAATIYKIQGVRPVQAKSRLSDFPLFVSITYLRFTGANLVSPKNGYLPSLLDLASHKDFMDRIVPNIEKEDLEELEQIDPHRAWRREEDYQLGKPWRLTAHQFRRSLALYASRSGLVSLSSLRRQLQHITEEMSMYYARGSAFSKNIIDGTTHFGREYQNTQPESEALAYIVNLLLSDERLFGAYGTWLEQRKRKDSLVITLKDRENTMRKFKRGEIAYKETLLGACTEPGPCNKKAMRSIVGCIDCARAAIKLSKLNRVIAAQESLVAELDPEAIEWRIEMQDLDVLTAARDKYLGQGA